MMYLSAKVLQLRPSKKYVKNIKSHGRKINVKKTVKAVSVRLETDENILWGIVSI